MGLRRNTQEIQGKTKWSPTIYIKKRREWKKGNGKDECEKSVSDRKGYIQFTTVRYVHSWARTW